MNLVIGGILVGYGIGAVIGYIWDKHISSPNYGINGKKEIETYMTSKYGQDWLRQLEIRSNKRTN